MCPEIEERPGIGLPSLRTIRVGRVFDPRAVPTTASRGSPRPLGVQMTVFTERDREISRCAYQEIADAVAAAVARREASVPVVFIAAYRHRFGIDVTAHATRPLAQAALHRIATRECSRDPALRDRVVTRFGCWPAQGIDDATLEELLAEWSQVAENEALWIAECDVETDATRRSSDDIEARDAAATLVDHHDDMHLAADATSHRYGDTPHDAYTHEPSDDPSTDACIDAYAELDAPETDDADDSTLTDADLDAPPPPDSYDLFDAVDESDIDPPIRRHSGSPDDAITGPSHGSSNHGTSNHGISNHGTSARSTSTRTTSTYDPPG